MAKTRLTNHKRDLLKKLARELVTKMIREKLKMDKVEEDFRQYMISKLKADYPAEDMAVLKKYGQVTTLRRGTWNDTLRVVYDHDSDTFREYKLVGEEWGNLLIPNGCIGDARNTSGPVARRFFEKSKEMDRLIDEKMADYKSLINTATTYEDVLDLWPAAESLRKAVTGTVTAVTTLNDAVKLRILNDQKEMVKLTVEEKKEAA